MCQSCKLDQPCIAQGELCCGERLDNIKMETFHSEEEELPPGATSHVFY